MNMNVCKPVGIFLFFVIVCFVLSSCCYGDRMEAVHCEMEILTCDSEIEMWVVSSKDELAELIMVDFTGLEIIQIKPFEFHIFVFCIGVDDALENALSYDNFWEYPIEFLSPACSRMLQMFDLTTDNVQRFAVKSRLRDRVPNIDSDWETLWYQLDGSHPTGGNILLYAYFPYRIEVHVDAILDYK